MKAILIDPHTHTISTVEYDGNYKSIYDLIDCSCFTVLGVDDNGNSIFLDDEGLYQEPQAFFMWEGYAQPLAGKGLILGTDDEGESIATNLSLEYVKAHVRFVSVRLSHFENIPEGTVTDDSHPMGAGVPVIGHIPVFEKE